MVDHTTRVETVVATPPFSRISWGAILAGTLCAFALQLFFNLVGLGVGLSSVDLANTGGEFASIGIGAGIWWAISAIASLMIGGWIAARLAGVPIRMTAALHGASVWALVTLLTIWLATTAVSNAVSGAFGAVGQIGQAAAQAVGSGANAAGNAASPLLAQAQTELNAAGQQRQSVMRSIRTEAREVFNTIVQPEEQQAAVDAVQQEVAETVQNPGQIGANFNQLVDRLFASGGVFTDEDRQQAIQALQQRTGVSQEEAERTIDNWQERYQQAVTNVEQSVEQLREQAAGAARATAEAVGAAAGWTSLALLLGAIAAVAGGILGKPQPWVVEAIEEEAASGDHHRTA